MAHQLTERANGLVEMAYVGATPWHNLGQELQSGASIEQWTVQAGMDWKIQRSKVRYAVQRDADAKAEYVTMADDHVLFRSDTKAPLGIVKKGFKVVQPSEVLEFFRDLVQGAGFELETAGTLFGGRRFWALANIGDDCEIVPGDKVGGYLLLCTGADGTLATTGKFTTVRVVCNNTLSMALPESAGAQYKISHKSVFDPLKMKQNLGIAHEEFSVFADNMRRLADKTVSQQRAERLIFDLLKPATFEAAEAEEKVEIITKVSESKGYRTIMSLFEGGGLGSDIDGVKGTAWGFVNAVTEYADYHVRAQSQENRLNSAWFGPGDGLKEKAVELALAI